MKDTYTELKVNVDEAFVDLIADYISNITGEAVEYGKGCVILRTSNDTSILENQLKNLDIKLDITKEEKENIDWIKEYQDSITPIEAGEFYIHPSWHEPKDGKKNILINPALAFGSGHHATTYSCLMAISQFVKSGDEVIDVGCGSGILSIASSYKGAVVDLCDTDELAVKSAIENFQLNNKEFRQIWIGSINKTNKKYDIVVANIIADVLKVLSNELKNHLKDEGILIVSGILDKKENIVTNSFKYLNLIKRVKKDEWVTLIYKKDKNG